MRPLIDALLHLIYPSFCVHCKGHLESRHLLLCPKCEQHLTLIDPQERCLKCFAECQSLARVCKRCQKKPSAYLKLAACFEHYGPGAALIHAFKDRLLLGKVLASWMALQLDKLHWPLPDLIIPFPQSSIDRFHEGYNRSKILSKELGSLFQIPIKELVAKKYHPQEEIFIRNNQADISDLTVLIIVETLISKSAVDACAKTLREGFDLAPKN